MPLHVSSTRTHRQEAKIVLYNLCICICILIQKDCKRHTP